MITQIISIVFAITFPITPLDYKVSDLVRLEAQRIEIQIWEEKQAKKQEILEQMDVLDQKEVGLNEEMNPKPSRTQKTGGTRGVNRDLGVFTVTAYDLSVQSCGKPIGHRYYGITANGTNLTGHTWETARAVAVDPKVIPLGSEIQVTFTNEDYSKYDGVYIAVDTGGAIKGRKIDFFMGDFNQEKTHQVVWDFGKTQAKIELIEKGEK